MTEEQIPNHCGVPMRRSEIKKDHPWWCSQCDAVIPYGLEGVTEEEPGPINITSAVKLPDDVGRRIGKVLEEDAKGKRFLTLPLGGQPATSDECMKLAEPSAPFDFTIKSGTDDPVRVAGQWDESLPMVHHVPHLELPPLPRLPEVSLMPVIPELSGSIAASGGSGAVDRKDAELRARSLYYKPTPAQFRQAIQRLYADMTGREAHEVIVTDMRNGVIDVRIEEAANERNEQ